MFKMEEEARAAKRKGRDLDNEIDVSWNCSLEESSHARMMRGFGLQ